MKLKLRITRAIYNLSIKLLKKLQKAESSVSVTDILQLPFAIELHNPISQEDYELQQMNIALELACTPNIYMQAPDVKLHGPYYWKSLADNYLQANNITNTSAKYNPQTCEGVLILAKEVGLRKALENTSEDLRDEVFQSMAQVVSTWLYQSNEEEERYVAAKRKRRMAERSFVTSLSDTY